MAKKAKRRSTISLRVKSVSDFFRQLEAENISYCSLRWPDDVPLDIDLSTLPNEEIDKKYGDIDLLVDLKKFAGYWIMATWIKGRLKRIARDKREQPILAYPSPATENSSYRPIY